MISDNYTLIYVRAGSDYIVAHPIQTVRDKMRATAPDGFVMLTAVYYTTEHSEDFESEDEYKEVRCEIRKDTIVSLSEVGIGISKDLEKLLP